MSLHQYATVNSTAIRHEASPSLLTPGQIAAITIVSTFVFYMTIMVLVCAGEYCKYAKDRSHRVGQSRQPRHQARHSRGTHNPRHQNGEPFELNVDPTSSIIPSPSLHSSDSMCGDSESYDPRSSMGLGSEPADSSDMVQVHYGNDVNRVDLDLDVDLEVEVDCVEACQVAGGDGYDRDSVILPLMVRQSCEESLDNEGEAEADILCDSVDSRNVYPLEADV